MTDRRRADQLSTVAEVSRAVASILDLDALLNEVVTLIHKRFGYPFVHLFTVHPGLRQIVYRAGLPLPLEREESEGSDRRSQVSPAQELVYSLDDPQGIIPWVARHGETVLANDVSREPRYRPSELPPASTRAELAVPLVFGGEVMGVLDVQSDRQDAFGEDDRFLFEALADSVAIAIRNANLYRSERWRRQVADSLREVAGLLSADVALDQVLDAILTELERTLPCDVAAIWLAHDNDLRLVAIHGCTAEDVARVTSLLSDADAWLDQALRADQPTIRTPQSSFEPLGAAVGFPPDYSAIAAPLRAGDRRLGLLALAHHTLGRYGVESRAMTAAFASYAAVAIENTRLYEAAQEQAWVSTVLLQVAEAAQSRTALDEVLETVVRLVSMLVGVDRCAVLLSSEGDHTQGGTAGTFIPAAAYGLNPAQQVAFDCWHIAPGDVPAFDYLRLVKAPIIVHDVTSDPRLPGDVVSALGFESLWLLPLLARGEVLGAMLVEEATPSPRFREKRLEILTGIAQQAALAVQNDQLRQEKAGREQLERELQLAREIQQTFMPSQLPRLPGWELAVAWRAARQVGGDFYDFFELPGGRLGLVIADVADKGMPAALFMALTRALVRAATLEDVSPAAALARVNDLLVPDAQRGMFVTTVYAVLSLETGQLAYANAGHNMPLLLRSRAWELERLAKGGMALGVLEGTHVEEQIVSLEPGDYLIFYTDGITEAFAPEGDVYGEERLWATIQAADGGSAQAMLDAINDSVTAFVGDNPPSDDITIMVLRRLVP